MNDKCAAGTGRFLSMACDTLGIFLEEIDTFTHPNEAIVINSMMVIDAITKAADVKVTTHGHANFAGAIGACVCAIRKYRGEA